MNAEELRAIQAPLKARYKENPASAKILERCCKTDLLAVWKALLAQ